MALCGLHCLVSASREILLVTRSLASFFALLGNKLPVRVNFQQDLKRLDCPFRSKLCEWEWTQVSTDPTAQCAHW